MSNLIKFLLFVSMVYSTTLFSQNAQIESELGKLRGRKIPSALLNQVSIHIDKEPLEFALADISEKGQLNLSYNRNLLPLKKKVSVHMDNVYAIKALLAVLVQTSTMLKITKSGALAIMPAGKSGTRKRSSRFKGLIKGVVTDSTSGDPLPGANVFIKGTSIGTATNMKGEFSLPKIQPGAYTIQITYIGYKNKELDVRLQPGKTLNIKAALSWVAVKGRTVQITAQASGTFSAINQQLTATDIKNVVSSDKIQEVPDVNAAESIGRLPGVSLQRSGGEGNKIVVRGLSPKYNIVEVDGVRLPATDTEDRSTGLNLISSEMLAGIELSKSLTPAMDADALGGTINLKLKEADEGLHYNLRTLGGYNGFEKNMGNYNFSGAVSNRFLNNKLGAILQLNTEKVDRSSDRFGGTYSNPEWFLAQDNTGAVVDSGWKIYSNSANLTRQKDMRYRTGGSLLMDFKTNNFKMRFNNFYSQMKDDILSRANSFNFSSSTEPFTLMITDHKPIKTIQVNSLHNHFGLLGTTVDINLAYTHTKTDNPLDAYHMTDRGAVAGIITKTQRLYADPGVNIKKYNISHMQSAYLDAMNKSWSNLEDKTQLFDLSWKIPIRLMKFVSGDIQLGGRYSKKNRKSNVDARSAGFKWGVGSSRQDDLIKLLPWIKRAQDVNLADQYGIPAINFLDPNYSYGNFLNGRYQLGWSADADKLHDANDKFYKAYGNNTAVYIIQGVPSNQNDYVNTEELSAGYIMTELNFGDVLMLLPGVRYEKMHTSYNAVHLKTDSGDTGVQPFVVDTTTIRDNQRWFPGINLKLKLNHWSNIRAAAYKSTSRPSFTQISPLIIYTVPGIRMYAHNPKLRPSTAINYDLGFSAFSNKVGLFTVNGFYKEIDDLIFDMTYFPKKLGHIKNAPKEIEESLLGGEYFDPRFVKLGYYTSLPVNNPNKAFYRGFEISWQTNLWYLPGLLGGLVLDLNYSMIWSSTNYPFFETVQAWDNSGIIPLPVDYFYYRTREGRMIDQPKSLYNVRIGWDHRGFSTRLSFRYQGATMSAVDAKYELKDSFTSALFRVDLSIKQNITKYLSFHANLANMNKHTDNAYLAVKNYELPISSEYYGFTAQFGLFYNF